jgi:HD-GYP domain-containing protein (c-di-GMP phosphodiesterase class II)
MDKIKAYFLKYFEQTFILLTLIVTVIINYHPLITQKIPFLNFYFLPIILAGYYLGRQKAVLGAFFAVLFISVYVYLQPEAFAAETTEESVWVHVLTWGCFLILSGAVVGRLQERLTEQVDVHRTLNADLQRQQEELNQAYTALKENSENLENLNRDLQRQQEELNRTNFALKERSEELELSKRAIESLKTKVEEALYATMDASVVKMIIEGRLRNEKRNVTILISDLLGFTSYSEEHPPEVVIRDLNRYLADMEPILLAYRGHIDKYMGDGILCEFGAPLDFATHRLMAVLAGTKMQERMAKLNYPWKMRIGIGSGNTITGLVGGSKRQSYTAIGDVVNLSTRLEQACRPGCVLIDRFTYLDVSRFIEARKKRDIPTKDISDVEKERHLESLHEKLTADPNNAGVYFQIGQVHLALKEVTEAFEYFERALERDPGNTDFKVAYAEASMQLKEAERLNLKGKRQRIEAYEVIGLKDPIENREKITQKFYDEYRSVADLIQIPMDVTLPVESLDGSIGHSKVVAVVSFALANCFGVPDKEKMDILHAGFMADIGKEIVPHHLLNRVGSINPGEFDMVKMHPDEGTRVLRKMGYENEAMLKIVRHSHENFNGSGYPEGLKGETIPLGSRIVAVADAYDALTAWRPYRDSWERHAALDEIRRGVGKGLYDPKVVDFLVKMLG